ncbi:MAG: hypothetical protein EOL97_14960 [Spirochaetia bacterium]|nr:hypothetical protein [Spirochaetia bacterium]
MKKWIGNILFKLLEFLLNLFVNSLDKDKDGKVSEEEFRIFFNSILGFFGKKIDKKVYVCIKEK